MTHRRYGVTQPDGGETVALVVAHVNGAGKVAAATVVRVKAAEVPARLRVVRYLNVRSRVLRAGTVSDRSEDYVRGVSGSTFRSSDGPTLDLEPLVRDNRRLSQAKKSRRRDGACDVC